MKSILCFVLLFSSSFVLSQTKEKAIKEIEQKLNAVDNSLKKKKVKKQFFEYTCPDRNERGSVWFIFKDKELQKIDISSVLNKEYRQTTRYYFWKGKLIYVFNESAKPESDDPANLNYIYTQKMVYFENEQAFRCFEKSYTNSLNSENKGCPENIANKEVDCKELEFIQQHLNKVQQYKDIKNEISLCIW